MRPAVVRVMSGVSLLVVGLSVRASRHQSDAALGVQPAGVVEGALTPASATPSPAARRATPTPSPTASKAPRVQHRAAPRVATPSPRPSPKPRVTTAPKPVTITVNGSPADTRYGPVQVQIELRSGHIVAARAIEYPSGSDRDQEINSYAIPQLDDETVQADSDQIDSVSGATYTSEGYRSSLQSALDAARQAGAR